MVTVREEMSPHRSGELLAREPCSLLRERGDCRARRQEKK